MNSVNLGKELRRIRNEKKMSLQDVANKLSVSPQAISQYELNKRDIPDLVLIHILQSLGVHPNDFVKTIKVIEDISDDEKRVFFNFLHELDFDLYQESDDPNSSQRRNDPVVNSGKTMVKNERFAAPDTDLIVRYQILILRENEPAMLKNESGNFDILIKLINSGKEFILNCSYIPLDGNGQWFHVTTNKVFFENVDPSATDSNYDRYADKIHPGLTEDIQIAIDNAIKAYFMETLRKPISIEPYHNI